MPQKTNCFSWKNGNIAKGCQYCVKGSKLVLFITGLCPRNCFYCPISDKKHGKDVVYADEWPTKNINDILREAELIDAEGAGITGGDPLCVLDRTISYITALKGKFGKKFHIHLYTSLNLVDEDKLKKLFDAGLDEIRFHAEIEDNKLWDRILLVNKFEWDVGIEIPVIPGKIEQTKKLIDFFQGQVKFINLNELEFADNSFNKLGEMNFETKDSLSYGVKGSEEMALELLRYCSMVCHKLNVHYCTAKLKDAVQMANRIKRRAENIAKKYDIITKEGLLFRGAIYSDDLGYVQNVIVNRYHIKNNLFEKDEARKRVLVGADWLNKNKSKLKRDGFKIALVEEYPTYDCLNVMTDFI
jgi:pyruvate formate-lyase activating enzyme-like uncharacterized protein